MSDQLKPIQRTPRDMRERLTTLSLRELVAALADTEDMIRDERHPILVKGLPDRQRAILDELSSRTEG